MKVRVLRPFLGNKGFVNEGEIIDVSESRAQDLEKNGLVVANIGAKSLRGDPTQPRRTGGQTGAEAQRSSSPEAPPPRKRTSRKRKAARK